MPIAKSVEDTILGEAKAGNFEDMVAIASVIDNRAAQTKTTYEDVVSAKDSKGNPQFDAYGKALPAGVGKYRDMAKQAVAQVKSYGPVHSATFYATPAATKGLPKGLAYETKTDAHQFFTDPQNRSVLTAQGYKTPDPAASRAPTTNIAGDPSGTLYDVAEARASTPVDGLLADFSSATGRGLASLAAPESTRSAQQATSPFGAILGADISQMSRAQMAATDIEDRPAFQSRQPGLVGVSAYNESAKRSEDPTSTIANEVQGMVDTMYGGKYSVGVYSGMEPKGLAAVGSNRHTRGTAIDYDVIDTVTGKQAPKSVVEAVQKTAAAKGYNLGVGNNKGYMNPGRTHIDRAMTSSVAPTNQGQLIERSTPSPISAGSGTFWAGDEQSRAMVADARMSGVMAPEMYDGLTVNNPRGVPTPTPAPRGQETYAAPVGPVERGTLGPVSAPAVAARGMTAPNFAGPIGPSYNIDQAGLTAPGFTGPAARSVSTQSIGRSGLAAPSGTTYGPAGATPAGFAELGVIGKTSRPGLAAPSFAPPSILGPIAMPTRQPYFAPVAPAMAPPVAPPAIAPPSAPSVAAPAMPSATGYDVWSGVAQTAPTTGGGRLSRNPDGSVSMTSKYGYTEVDGQYRGKVDPNTVGRLGQVSIPGPLGNVFGRSPAAQQQTQQQAPRSFGPSMRGIGPAARGVAGSVAGSVVGGMLGPLGAVLGATIGRNLATGKTALGKFQDFGRVTMPTPTQARSAFAQGFTPGLGFPTAPSGNASQGGLTSFGEEASRGDHGGQAQSAANSPGRGLY